MIGTGPVWAQSGVDDIVQHLRAQGYTQITRQRTLLGRIRVTATGGGREREIVLNPSTGAVLRDYTRDNADPGGAVQPRRSQGGGQGASRSGPDRATPDSGARDRLRPDKERPDRGGLDRDRPGRDRPERDGPGPGSRDESSAKPPGDARRGHRPPARRHNA